MKLLNEHAKEKANATPEWHWHTWRAMPPGYAEIIYHEIVGAVAPLRKTGKRKGEHNWAKKDKSTERTVIITPKEHETWLREWSLKTGKCANCYGEGQVWIGWGRESGNRYKPCAKCSSTGRAAIEAREAELIAEIEGRGE
jgi:hypothetical protein